MTLCAAFGIGIHRGMYSTNKWTYSIRGGWGGIGVRTRLGICAHAPIRWYNIVDAVHLNTTFGSVLSATRLLLNLLAAWLRAACCLLRGCVLRGYVLRGCVRVAAWLRGCVLRAACCVLRAAPFELWALPLRGQGRYNVNVQEGFDKSLDKSTDAR